MQRAAGLRTYLTEVSDGQVHACQLLPHRLCQIETQGASSADSDAQEHSCRHGQAECITLTSNINTKSLCHSQKRCANMLQRKRAQLSKDTGVEPKREFKQETCIFCFCLSWINTPKETRLADEQDYT